MLSLQLDRHAPLADVTRAVDSARQVYALHGASEHLIGNLTTIRTWLEPFRWHGNLAAIPRDPSMVVLYFNPSSFSSAGQAVPGTAESARLSWEEVVSERRR